MSPLVVTLASQLSTLAADYDASAAELAREGGSWALVVAGELHHDAAQLRAARDTLAPDATPSTIAAAAAIAHAAAGKLERIAASDR